MFDSKEEDGKPRNARQHCHNDIIGGITMKGLWQLIHRFFIRT